MKFGQIIFSISISALLFAAVFVTENARFNFKDNIKNPFHGAENIDNFIKNNKNKSIDVFTYNGEFFRLYPGSSIDFIDNTRELLDGEFFISSQFITDKSFLSASSNFISPFKASEFKPNISQFKIGEIFISIPNASVFIKRDKEGERIKIYAIDHSIEIFLENAKVPFIVPANMSIDIRESILSDKTGQLYYTKLKKELSLKELDLSSKINDTKSSSFGLQDKINLALSAKDKINKSMKSYAQNMPHVWLWFENQGFIGGISTFIQKLQINFSIGYPSEKANRFKINKVLKPFVQANTAVKNNDPDSAVSFLNEFNAYFKTKEWFKLLLKSSFEKNWNDFTNIQKAWLRGTFPNDPASVFIDFWSVDDDKDSFDLIKNKFNSVELLLPRKQYTEALDSLIKINEIISDVKINKNELRSITKLRRILFELIKENVVFQKKQIFELYGFFIKKEVDFYENEEKDEIQLESAQDILLFLDKFLNKDDKADISSFLVNVYGILNVDEITKKRNRVRIFTEKEIELIDIIKKIGSTGLTPDGMRAIQDQLKRDKERRKRDAERITIVEKPKTINKNLINTKELFISYLEYLKINTKRITISSVKKDYKFSNAVYGALKVSGTFNIKNQKFTYLKVGNEIERDISKKIIIGLLVDMEENNHYIDKPKNIIKTTPQNTSRAITERDSVRSWFDGIGIVMDFVNIEAIDLNYNKFKIKDSVYNNKVRLSFLYYKDADVLEKLIIYTGRTPLEIPYKIKRNELIKEIDRILFELIEEKKNVE